MNCAYPSYQSYQNYQLNYFRITATNTVRAPVLPLLNSSNPNYHGYANPALPANTNMQNWHPPEKFGNSSNNWCLQTQPQLQMLQNSYDNANQQPFQAQNLNHTQPPTYQNWYPSKAYYGETEQEQEIEGYSGNTEEAENNGYTVYDKEESKAHFRYSTEGDLQYRYHMNANKTFTESQKQPLFAGFIMSHEHDEVLNTNFAESPQSLAKHAAFHCQRCRDEFYSNNKLHKHIHQCPKNSKTTALQHAHHVSTEDPVIQSNTSDDSSHEPSMAF